MDPPYSKYHLPRLLRGVEGPHTTMPEMKVIRKITAKLNDCLCILFLIIIACTATQPWVSGVTEAGISWRDTEIGSRLSALLWRMTKSLAALGASCVLRLQMSSWASILDAVWARAEAGPGDTAGVSCTIYTSVREGGDTRSKKHPHQDPPSFLLSLSLSLALSLYYIISSPDSVKKAKKKKPKKPQCYWPPCVNVNCEAPDPRTAAVRWQLHLDWDDRHILFTVLATEVIFTGAKLVHSTTTFHTSPFTLAFPHFLSDHFSTVTWIMYKCFFLWYLNPWSWSITPLPSPADMSRSAFLPLGWGNWG